MVDRDEGGRAAIESAGHAVKPEKSTTCCYAVSDKHWVVDPAGTPWETFRTMAQVKTRGTSSGKAEAELAALAATNVAAAETAGAEKAAAKKDSKCGGGGACC